MYFYLETTYTWSKQVVSVRIFRGENISTLRRKDFRRYLSIINIYSEICEKFFRNR